MIKHKYFVTYLKQYHYFKFIREDILYSTNAENKVPELLKTGIIVVVL